MQWDQWDLGIQGIALMAAIAVGFGAAAAVLAGGRASRRIGVGAAAAIACFVVGLWTSEVFFGWATEAELQPNVDGLSRDEVLLSSALTTLVVVLAAHLLGRRRRTEDRTRDARRR